MRVKKQLLNALTSSSFFFSIFSVFNCDNSVQRNVTGNTASHTHM